MAAERSRAFAERNVAARAAITCFAALFVQLVLGAWMRHSDAGLAIPDFPASFGRLWPDHWNSRIAVHFAHRAWALVVVVTVFSSAAAIRRRTAAPGARRSALLLAAFLPVQFALGAASIWTRKAVPVTVAHQTLGALLLACSAAMAIFALRERFLARSVEGAGTLPRAAGAAR